MPIDYTKYPDNWKTEIRPAILERDNHECTDCGLKNYSIGFRHKDGSFEPYELTNGVTFKEQKAIAKSMGLRLIKIVLTIAHLDHDITNNDYNNLSSKCQKCHLDYDKEHHEKNRRETLKQKKQQKELF